MPSKPKKMKVAMEPVLQDFTVTSISDLNPGLDGPSDSSSDVVQPELTFNQTSDINISSGPYPSDSSLFEEIRSYNVVLPEVTFNQTADKNMFSSPYPSDSSIDSFMKENSHSKTNSKIQLPFQKLPRKKIVEENLFDSCLKDSFSDHSTENLKKTLQTKQKKNIRLSIFDSDLEKSTSTKDSPFKKPLQKKCRIKRQSNLFDSVMKDTQPDTPDYQTSRTLQRKSKKKISSNSFDDVFSNDSFNRPTPVQTFITRRNNRTKKSDDSNLFDVELNSSQSDVSMSLQSNKPSTTLNNSKNDTEMLWITSNESFHKNSIALDPHDKNDDLNEENTGLAMEPIKDIRTSQQFCEENKIAGELTDGKNTLLENAHLKFQENVGRNIHCSDMENQELAELTHKQNTSKASNSLKFQDNINMDEIEGQSTTEINFPKGKVAHDKNKDESEYLHEKLKENSVFEETVRSNVDKELQNTQCELSKTLKSKTQHEEATLQLENAEAMPSEKSIIIETEDENTIVFELGDEMAKQTEHCSDIRADSHYQSSFLRCESIQTMSLPSSQTDKILCPLNSESNFEQLNIKVCTPNEIKVCTPNETFENLPSSTPNVKGKRVSFLLKEVECFRGIDSVNENLNGMSTRKSSVRSSKRRSSNSSNVNNITKDNSLQLRRRRVSFKINDRESVLSKQSSVRNSEKCDQSEANQSNNYSSVSLESLVYNRASNSKIDSLDSDSVFIDIHPSRSKSKSISNTESFSNSRKKDRVEVSEEENEEEMIVEEEDEDSIEEEDEESVEEEDEDSVEEEDKESVEEEDEDSVEEEEEDSVEEEEEQISVEEEEGVDVDEDGRRDREHVANENSRLEGLVSNYIESPEQDENLNPSFKTANEFKIPFKKTNRRSSLFEEKHLELPSKSQLKDILNKIPITELKKKRNRNSTEHYISKEQMQQYEIEEELIKNRKKKTQNVMNTIPVSGKLKRPKKWISPRLYDLLINKLKPQFGIRSRVRSEELVLFLVDKVENIKKKKELSYEDVMEMKMELARLGIVKTHWDFFKFVNQFFEYHVKEKMYPSLPGGRSAFEFGPSNVLENIL